MTDTFLADKKDSFYMPSGITSSVMPHFVAPPTLPEKDRAAYQLIYSYSKTAVFILGRKCKPILPWTI